MKDSLLAQSCRCAGIVLKFGEAWKLSFRELIKFVNFVSVFFIVRGSSFSLSAEKSFLRTQLKLSRN